MILRIGMLAGAIVLGIAPAGAQSAADAGRDVYTEHCATCHGERLNATGAAPDLKLLGGAAVGASPFWLTVSPDNKSVYVANCGDNDVTVIDVRTIKQVSHIPVGQCPERNIAVMLPDGLR